MKRRIVCLCVLFLTMRATADLVHVIEQAEVGGVTNVVSDTTKLTGMPWATAVAPTISGQIFTHWTISTKQDFASRDEWGRAYDAPSFKLYEDTTLTAHYLPETQDTDGDGVPDGYEIYWYGNLGQGAMSDTDGDGWTFAEELANGTNPLTPEVDIDGPIAFDDGELLLYNPSKYASVIIRSEPDGLFAANEEWLRPGTYVETGSYSPATTKFAYWTRNGSPMRDAWGRAVEQVSFMMSSNTEELVAVVIDDYETRMKLYWYGTTEIAMEGDTDGDGFTFAEELANGTNPLTPELDVDGPITYADGELLQYNPRNLQPYTIKSDPEGALFETINDYAPFGTFVDATTYSPNASTFACWLLNGVEQRDAWGRAVETMSLQMSTNAQVLVAKVMEDDEARQKYYWYGTNEIAMDSDTDGDGFTFAEELANGTNPLTPELEVDGPITYADTELREANLQPFEQAQGALVDGAYCELFYSPIADNSGCVNFGPEAVPNVVDVNGDGLFDMVVVSTTGHAVLVNVGTTGNPQFEYRTDVPTNGLPLVKGGLERLVGLSLDVTPADAVSCTFGDVDQDGVADLLVSDAEGRIWYYHNSNDSYYLQNKVWAGSRDSFADKLYLTAVDWDGDGDMDCVCGTAEGRLMLLVDPRIGRPMNVKAQPGADSVVLTWDASVNSRVRGYGVYRGVTSNDCTQIQSLWPLPSYRDVPSVLQDYYYRVTSMSRHYISGSSAPIVSESMPTDAVYVQFRPSVWLNDTSSFTDTNVEVIVSMNNSMGISSDGLSMTFAYDSAVLEPVEMKKTGLTEELKYREEVEKVGGGGQWRIISSGGEIGTGAGRFLRLVFYVKPVLGVTNTVVSITAATVKAKDGRAVTLELPKSATIEICERKPKEPAVVAVHVDDAAVETETEFELGVTVTSTETLTNFVADVSHDGRLLELRSVSGAARLESAPYRVASAGGDFALKFYARNPESVLTNLSTVVSLTNIVAVDCHGFTVSATNASGMVLLKNKHPWIPATVSVSTVDKKVDTLEEVVVPFKVTSSTALSAGTFTVAWDDALLEFVVVNGGSASSVGCGEGTASAEISATGDFSLTFLAKDQHTVTKTQVSVTSAQVTDVHGFVVSPEVPVSSTILIHDAHPLIPAEVAINAGDVRVMTKTRFTVPVTITSTKTLTNLNVCCAWDSGVFAFEGAVGAVVSSQNESSAVISCEGSVPTTVMMTFYAKEQHTVKSSTITLSDGAAVCTDALAANVSCLNGKVTIIDSNPPVAANAIIGTRSARVTSGETFQLPIGRTSDADMVEYAVTLTWDSALSYQGAAMAKSVTSHSATSATFAFNTSGTMDTDYLTFKAPVITGLQLSSWVKISAASGTSANGLSAKITSTYPITSPVLIVREIGRYSPGDINGDGKLTDADKDLLENCIKYQSIVKANPKLASKYASWNLAGSALKAADVNSDGKVDVSDLSLLVQWIAEYKELNK